MRFVAVVSEIEPEYSTVSLSRWASREPARLLPVGVLQAQICKQALAAGVGLAESFREAREGEVRDLLDRRAGVACTPNLNTLGLEARIHRQAPSAGQLVPCEWDTAAGIAVGITSCRIEALLWGNVMGEELLKVLTISESTWANAAPGSVWRWILELREWPSWNNTVESAQWRGESGWKPGHRLLLAYRDSGRFLGGGLLTGARVLEVVPFERLRWSERFLAFKVDFEFRAVSEGVGTRVHFSAQFHGLSARVAGNEVLTRRFSRFQRDFIESLRGASERVMGKVL